MERWVPLNLRYQHEEGGKEDLKMAMLRPPSISKTNFLRKRRKWPLSPYKTTWHENFHQRQAMQTLKNTIANQPSPPPQQLAGSSLYLSILLDSFRIYNSDPTPNAYHFLITTLTHSRQFHHLPPLLHRLENSEKFETPEFIFINLIKMYGNAHMLQDAVDIFSRIPNFRCVPSVYSLNALLYVLCKRREGIAMVPQILLKSQAMKMRLEESSFRILVAALCRIKRHNYAIRILSYMLNDGYAVDAKMCSFILSSLCNQKALSGDEVLRFMEEMRKLGFYPTRVDFNNVIRFLVKEGMLMDALGVFDQMKSDGIKPDTVTYTLILNGVVTEGNYGKADDLFDEMLLLGVVPDIHAYNAYVNGLCKQNDIQGGVRMLASMRELGCGPNCVTYNMLLEGMSKVGDLSGMRELVREMDLKCVQWNWETYRIMLDSLTGKGEMDESCVLLDQMLDKSFAHWCSTFDEIICELCKRGLVRKALQLVSKMACKTIAPGARTWEALLGVIELSFAEAILTELVIPLPMQRVRLQEHQS